MYKKKLFDAIAGITEASSVCELQSECEKFSKALGFDFFQFLTISVPGLPSSSEFRSCGYPYFWGNSDGLAQLIAGELTKSYLMEFPYIIWSRSGVHDNFEKVMVRRNTGFIRTQFYNGISYSVKTHEDEFSLFGFFSLNSDACRLINKVFPYISMIASLVFLVFSRVNKQIRPTDNQQVFKLTPRETACLEYAAIGKTSTEIAQLMSLSVRTINFHFDNAMVKLHVTNRTEAVAKSITAGLIHYRDRALLM